MENENDLISRKALLERLDNRTKTAYPNAFYGLMLAHDYIEDASAVEAEPVKHGRYIQKPNDEWWAPYYVCLECGSQMMVADEEGRNIKPNLCPNCGAKMDGERR